MLRRAKLLLTPVIVTISIDVGAISGDETRIFDWAVAEAVSRWNSALSGSHRLLRVSGNIRPHILIEAMPQPFSGLSLGECSHPGTVGYSRDHADNVIRIVTTAATEPTVFPLAPDKVRNSVEHEIGHALGLADTYGAKLIMSATSWNAELPCPGGTEAASIRRFKELLERFSIMLNFQWRDVCHLDTLIRPINGRIFL